MYPSFTYCCLSSFKGVITPSNWLQIYFCDKPLPISCISLCMCPFFLSWCVSRWSQLSQNVIIMKPLSSTLIRALIRRITLTMISVTAVNTGKFWILLRFSLFFFRCWCTIVMMLYPWVDIYEMCDSIKHTMDFWCEIAILSKWK